MVVGNLVPRKLDIVLDFRTSLNQLEFLSYPHNLLLCVGNLAPRKQDLVLDMNFSLYQFQLLSYNDNFYFITGCW